MAFLWDVEVTMLACKDQGLAYWSSTESLRDIALHIMISMVSQRLISL